MQVINQNVPFEFYQEFAELVRNSSLQVKAGTIVLSTDWATMDASATIRDLNPGSPPKLLGHGRTANGLFTLVLAAIEPALMPSVVPQTLDHPGPGRWWWLCFLDPGKPEGEQFLGVAVVEGRTLRDAMDFAAKLGIKPGGRVASVACTRYVPNARWRCRLLTRTEVIAAGNDMEAAEQGC